MEMWPIDPTPSDPPSGAFIPTCPSYSVSNRLLFLECRPNDRLMMPGNKVLAPALADTETISFSSRSSDRLREQCVVLLCVIMVFVSQIRDEGLFHGSDRRMDQSADQRCEIF